MRERGCTMAFRHVEIVDGQMRDAARLPHALCHCEMGTMYHTVHHCTCKFEWSEHTYAEYVGLAAARGLDYGQGGVTLRWSLITSDQPQHLAQNGTQTHYEIDCPGPPRCLGQRP